MDLTLKTELSRLEQLRKSAVVGICYLDSQGRLMQVFDQDDAFRTLLLDYQTARINQLSAQEGARPNGPAPYPVQPE